MDESRDREVVGMPGRLARRIRRQVCAAVMAAGTALAGSAPPCAAAAPAVSVPRADRPVGQLLTELQSLYHKAEEATERYNGVEERLRKQQAETARLGVRLARARTRLAEGRGAAGRAARQQYQTGSGLHLTPVLRLLLSDDAHGFVTERQLVVRIAARRAAAVGRLTGDEKQLTELTDRARRALGTQRALAEKRRQRRDTVRERLEKVEELLASLSDEQLEAVRRLEEEAVREAQGALVDAGTLRGHRPASRRGAGAVRYALAQVGKAYAWGAEGPDSFDSSGLVWRAWGHAGLEIPRTGREQWETLPRVSLRRLRPGDVVVYSRGATHVALYAGGGEVVHATRPDTGVRVSPLASGPLLGAVRPGG